MAAKIENKEITVKELAHYFYHIGSLDGIIASMSGDGPKFPEKYKEFEEQNWKVIND